MAYPGYLVYTILNVQKCNQVIWNKISGCLIEELRNLHFQINQQCEIIFINQAGKLCLIRISPKLDQKAFQTLEQQQVLQSTIVNEAFVKIKQHVLQIQIDQNNRYKKKPIFKKIIDFTVIHKEGILHIFQLDKFQTLRHHIKQYNQWVTCPQKQSLNWEEIQKDCSPIGDQGWHADAFYNKKLNLVVKKMRSPILSYIYLQINNLDYLSAYLPIKCQYQLTINGKIGGFTLNFIPGEKWDNILQRQGNLFAKSPVARVLFVIKLAKIMKILQQNSFCHGDLHLSNILIDIKNEDPLQPLFDIEVIDFGNGFIFEPNKLVSQGLTGLSIIVPFQAQSVKKQNYDPIGINAHQLGRNALQILLLTRHFQAHKLEYSPIKQLQQLKQKNEYPQQINQFIMGLLHENPYERNKYLLGEIQKIESITAIKYNFPRKE